MSPAGERSPASHEHATAGADVVERLLRFEVDRAPDVALGFRARLARENGWSMAFASRVYDEYRRFLVLAASADHPVTPSDEVDQAWHLHLVYTRSYWDDLCRDLLGTPLHHGPTEGGAVEGVRYRDQYERTLATYRRTFGVEPPADIWPPSAERFRTPERWRRVDTRAHLVVRRAAVVAVGLALVVVAGLTAAASDGDEGSPAVVFLITAGVIVAIIAMSAVANRRKVGTRGRSGGGYHRGAGGIGWYDTDGGSSGGDREAGGFLSGFFGGSDGGGSDGGSDGGSGCGSSGCGGGGCGGGGGD